MDVRVRIKPKSVEKLRVAGGNYTARKVQVMPVRVILSLPSVEAAVTVFGPRPRNYGIKVNKKARALARRSVLSHKAKDDAIRVIEDFTFDSPDTHEIRQMISALELGSTKVLMLTAAHDANVYLSGRNIPKFKVLEASQASTLDLLDAKTLLIQEGAVKSLSALLGSKKSSKK